MSPSSARISTAVLFLLIFALPLLGQSDGSVHVTLRDEAGEPIVGATVTLRGAGAPRSAVTDLLGQARFLALDPGWCEIEAALEGFGSVSHERVEVRGGRATAVPLVMVTSLQQTVSITSESPLLDERQVVRGTTVTAIELEKLPTVRDGSTLLTQTPGVQVDRINVGGSESFNAPQFSAPGAGIHENTFQIDGVDVTDAFHGGNGLMIFDFDQYAEINYSTGGSDVTRAHAGVNVELVTRRGTNEFRGSARFYATRGDGYFGGYLEQAEPDLEGSLHPDQVYSADCEGGTATGQFYCADRIDQLLDRGFEAGGAIDRDRLWAWGSWGENDVDLITPSGDPEDVIWRTTALKLNAQPIEANSLVASWNHSDKVWIGRGAGPARAPETVFDQRGPLVYYRVEDTHVFTGNLFVTGLWGLGDLGFELNPRGLEGIDALAPEAPDPLYDSDGVWKQNFLTAAYTADSQELQLDAAYFFTTGSLAHELAVGGRYRDQRTIEQGAWGPRRVIQTYWGTTIADRGVNGPVTVEHKSLWAQDTLTFRRLTVNAGVRVDLQEGINEVWREPAHGLFPESMPAVAVERAYSDVDWQSIVPRVAATYALGADRDTLLRASFAQFASQLAGETATWTAPTRLAYGYFYGGSDDGLYYAYGFDPLYPDRSPNTVDPGLEPELTSELLLAVEHAVAPELVLGATLTLRNVRRIFDFRPNLRADESGGLRPATRDDYVGPIPLEGTLPVNYGGDPYQGEYWLLADRDPFSNLPGAASGGSHWENGARERDYAGVALSFTKRLSRGWMARGFVDWGEAEWSVPDEWLRLNDPTPTLHGGEQDGDLFLFTSSGSGKGIRGVQSSWSANLNGLYQLAPQRPWGFNVAANVTAREGNPLPFRARGFALAQVRVVDPIDRFRMDDIVLVDLRLEKELGLSRPLQLTFGIDVFNLFNETPATSVQTLADVGNAGYVFSNLGARVFRLGVRLGWR